MTPLSPLQRLIQRSDLLLAAGLMVVIALMIIPLPTFLLDLLLSLNLAISTTLLITSLYARDPLGLSALPSILLLSTLFRLALNISTTRLILLNGDAGSVVDAFGGFVVQGSVLVGVVVFLLITLVQLVVIARGAERIAEVAARFSLDAMPGRQLAIDADLRAGALSHPDAAQARLDLQRQSALCGAMDGAMKFIKGDAIAGLLITSVNISAGLFLGVALGGLSLGDALQTYARLTVGDGLVSQIPALLTALAAAILTTRVETRDPRPLGAEIAAQLLAFPRALAVTAVALGCFALVPGLPTLPFLALAAATGGLAAWAHRAQRAPGDAQEPRPEACAEDPLVLALPQQRWQRLTPDARRALEDHLTARAAATLGELGVPPCPCRLRGPLPHQPQRLTLLLRGLPAADLPQPEGHTLVRAWPRELQQAGVEPLPSQTWSSRSAPLAWVPDERVGDLPPDAHLLLGAEALDALLDALLRTYAWRLLALTDTLRLLEDLPPEQQPLRDACALAPPQLHATFQRLLRLHLPLRPLPTILDALASTPAPRDPAEAAERVRDTLAALIPSAVLPPDEHLQLLPISRDLEQSLRAAQRASSPGRPLPDDLRRQLHALALTSARPLLDAGVLPLFTAPTNLRAFAQEALQDGLPDLLVLTVDELPPATTNP